MRGKRIWGREIADVAAWYSVSLPILSDYRLFVALWLNLPRVRIQFSWGVMEGFMAGSSTEDIDSSWAEAVALHPAETEEILFATNVPRADARLRAKLNWYGG